MNNFINTIEWQLDDWKIQCLQFDESICLHIYTPKKKLYKKQDIFINITVLKCHIIKSSLFPFRNWARYEAVLERFCSAFKEW